MILHETWNVLDSSKLETYMRCPRKYWYQYVAGWQPASESIHLVFGKAWHKAMRRYLISGYEAETQLMAITDFITEYRKSFSADTDALYVPKSPANADIALAKYIYEYCDRDNFEVMHTEVGGTVAIGHNRVLHFKMDSILRDRNNADQIISLEHKTGSQNSSTWRDSFKMSPQVGTYNHVLYCMFPEPEVWGVLINGAIFTKSKGVEFVRIPARRRFEMMDVWLATVNHFYTQVMLDYDMLQDTEEGARVMTAFTQCPTSCTQYGVCTYIDFCMSWPNPLQHLLDMPEGFETQFWDPRAEELDMRVEVKL
jgi:CRISPR/Cas system-associated exonuclease Cas4 (RecB family)